MGLNTQPRRSSRIRFDHRKGEFTHIKELIEAGTRPSEGDLAHAIRVMFKSGTETPKGFVGDVTMRNIVNENWHLGLIEWT
jgi:hypothetical protein